jgi:membrane protein DedA with SNARE-associated domain
VAAGSGIPAPLMFVSVMLGSLTGACVDFALGRYVGSLLARAPSPGSHRFLSRLPREQLLLWEERFQRRGAFWLLINRFLPGVRGPIFFAAGVSKVSFAVVLLWGGLSALVWNAILFALGLAVGGEAAKIDAALRNYNRAIGSVIGLFLAFWLVRWAWRRRVKAASLPSDSKDPSR